MEKDFIYSMYFYMYVADNKERLSNPKKFESIVIVLSF